MRVVLISAIALAILAGPARAQFGGEKAPNPLQLKYEAERKEQAENEKKYNETMRSLRSQEPSTKADPWRNMRATETQNKR